MKFDGLADPEVKAWCDRLEPPGDAGLYVQVKVRVGGVVALAEVAMPTLVEAHGMVLIESNYLAFSEEDFQDWQERLGDDRAALARVVNHFVVWDELDTDGDRDDRSDEMAAEFVAACWRARAAEQFPERNIIVAVVEQYGPTVVMYEPNADGPRSA